MGAWGEFLYVSVFMIALVAIGYFVIRAAVKSGVKAALSENDEEKGAK